MTEDEKNFVVSVEQEIVRVENGTLVMALKFSRPLVGPAQASVYCFGYRPDVPFPAMPKIHVRIGAIDCKVFDQYTELKTDTVTLERQGRRVTLKLPFKTLGYPKRVLTNIRGYLTQRETFDRKSWRIVELPALVK